MLAQFVLWVSSFSLFSFSMDDSRNDQGFAQETDLAKRKKGHTLNDYLVPHSTQLISNDGIVLVFLLTRCQEGA